MRDLIRLKASRAVWPAVAAVAVTAAVTGAAGVVAAPGSAARVIDGGNGSYRHTDAGFKRPKLKRGVLTVRGTGASDKIALRLQAGDAGVLQIDVGDDGSADFDVKRIRIAEIVVNAGSGDDLVRIDELNGVFTDRISTTIAGGDGDDTLSGGRGFETTLGGDGNDTIDGNGGNDLSLMGAGDDTFVWDPGDGSDTVEGQAGLDTMRFNGAGAAERVDLTANGSRLRFFRDPGTITMDTAGVEQVDFNALGGADVVNVNDLTATDVSELSVDLAATLGGVTGDGLADRIVVNGTNGDDAIDVGGDPSGVKVSGLAATIRIDHPEGANDRLEIDTLAGTDAVESSGLTPGAIQLFVDGVLVP